MLVLVLVLVLDAALVMVEEVRSAGAALLCTQHTPAAPWVARVCLTAVPQSCFCKLHEPAPGCFRGATDPWEARWLLLITSILHKLK